MRARWRRWWHNELGWLTGEDAAAGILRASHLNFVNRLTPVLLVVNLIDALLLCLVMYNRIGTAWLALWLFLTLVWLLVAALSWWRKHRFARRTASPRAVRRVTHGALGVAVLWVLAAVVSFPVGDAGQRFLVGMLVLGSLNGGVLALATVPTAAWAYLGAMTVGASVALVWWGGPYTAVLLTALLIYACAQAWMALLMSRNFTARLLSERAALRSQADLEAARDQLISSEKMAALGGLVAGVSHEVNTPLGVSVTAASAVRDVLDDLRREYQEGRMSRESFEAALDTAMEGLTMLETNLNRATRLVRDFKQTAVHQTSERLCDFDVMETVRALLVSLHPVTRRLPVRPMLGGPPRLLVRGYPGALIQVLTNLIMNSLAHGFIGVDKPGIAIDIRVTEPGWDLIYTDNGVGVPLHLQSRIFEPFFTTRRGEGGTGLGLNIVYTLVTQRMGGQLSFRSQPGSGVRLHLTLPRHLVSDRPDSQSPDE